MEINVNQKLIPSFRHPYSRTKKIHLLPKRSNYDEPGKFAFRIDGTTVEEAYGKFLTVALFLGTLVSKGSISSVWSRVIMVFKTVPQRIPLLLRKRVEGLQSYVVQAKTK